MPPSREGLGCSACTVGRTLHRLKERGVLQERVSNHIWARQRQWQRPYSIRKPNEYEAKEPGNIVEVDTLDVSPLPGMILKHFTAGDIIPSWDVLEVHTCSTSRTASGFTDTVLEGMPFSIKAIQVDGGSKLQDAFETDCQRRGIKLFVLPSRSS